MPPSIAYISLDALIFEVARLVAPLGLLFLSFASFNNRFRSALQARSHTEIWKRRLVSMNLHLHTTHVRYSFGIIHSPVLPCPFG